MARRTIKDCEQLIEKQAAIIENLNARINQLETEKDQAIMEDPRVVEILSECKRLEARNQYLEKKNGELQERISAQPGRTHNERGAGRKPMDEKMQGSLEQFRTLVESGWERDNIMRHMSISLPTYYRYRKIIKN